MNYEDVYSYEDCFALYPGVTEVEAKYYGSYQGEFLCRIVYNGEILYIHDWYGSCSGCDAFEAEFAWSSSKTKKNLINFAKSYIGAALPKEKMIKYLEHELDEWDTEKREMLQDLKDGVL